MMMLVVVVIPVMTATGRSLAPKIIGWLCLVIRPSEFLQEAIAEPEKSVKEIPEQSGHSSCRKMDALR